ncbi:MAG: sugar phosphate isomerase/epimerase family protein [Syntrophobacteraceae bacterium]
MRLSFSTNAFVKFSILEAIESIAKAWYSGVEILADVPHLYAFGATDSELADIAAALDKNSLHCANINANTAVGYYGAKFWEPLFEPSLAHPERDARKWRMEYTKKCIDMAQFLSCPNISITSGRMVPGTKPKVSLEYLKESLAEVLDYAVARAVRIGMEYEPGLLIERFEELKELIGEIGSENFGANLDLGHSHLLEEDPVEVITSLSSKIFHIHIEDILDKKHYHLLPGEGDMDFGRIFNALESISYGGFATVELYTYPDCPEYAARKAFDFINNLKTCRTG